MTSRHPPGAWLVAAVLLLVATTGWSQVGIPPPDQARPVFSAKSELVVLHVSITDSQGRYVRGLEKDAFRVIDGEPREIELFSGQDVPASIGVLIDNSGSMQPSRERVVAAALTFAETSHPDDEIFVLTFNEHVRQAWGPAVVSQTDPAVFKAAVARSITAAGMTAIHDGIVEGLRRVRTGVHTRQALIVISDGDDNASTANEADVIKLVHDSDATIYAVGLTDPVTLRGNPALLRRLTKATGGSLFQPRKVTDVPAALRQIALDIRSAYTLAYSPGTAAPTGARRLIRVEARSPDGRRLTVRTRDGYYLKTIAAGPGHD
jgi:Ca-activated chloride channel family protein